jgi:multiple antibiotic resistance protein
MVFDIVEILKVTMVLFAVIDIIGSIPIIIALKERAGSIDAFKASLVSFSIMIVFLFLGNSLLGIIGISISNFAIAGSIVLFIVAFEMILGIQISKDGFPAHSGHRNAHHAFVHPH